MYYLYNTVVMPLVDTRRTWFTNNKYFLFHHHMTCDPLHQTAAAQTIVGRGTSHRALKVVVTFDRLHRQTRPQYSYTPTRCFTRHDVVVQYLDVLVAVHPRVLVVEAHCVEDLVHDVPHQAAGPDENLLLAAVVADERRAAVDEVSVGVRRVHAINDNVLRNTRRLVPEASHEVQVVSLRPPLQERQAGLVRQHLHGSHDVGPLAGCRKQHGGREGVKGHRVTGPMPLSVKGSKVMGSQARYRSA